MRRWTQATVALFAALLMTGCAYTKIRVPMDRDFDDTTLGTKEGRSHSRTVLFLVSWGNSGTKAAADNGDIKVIKHADTEIFSVCFGAYTRISTVVYGD